MRIIVVGERLDKYLFEIIKSTERFGCGTIFFKQSIDIPINLSDVIVIDGDMITVLPRDLKNSVISIAFSPNYNKKLENEIVTNIDSIKFIGEIIEGDIGYCDLPIAIDNASMDVFKIAEKVALTDATVLITGETGTGKEVLARYIHRFSDRSDKKFVAINCAAIPDTLLESELFGHEKGAFTSAVQRRIGKFEEGHLGTVLLDEISEMSMSLQAKLLRVIQEKEFSRLGGNARVKVDTRIIATSNKNLHQAVQNGIFREDLFYRLSVIPINIPKLCERSLDIIPLAIFFCKKYSNSKKKISADLLHALKNHNWPGNIRELENFVHRAVILSPNDLIDIDNVKFGFLANGHCLENNSLNEQKTLAQIEKETILKTLEKFGGNKSVVSEKLGIPIRTLRYKLKLYRSETAA